MMWASVKSSTNINEQAVDNTCCFDILFAVADMPPIYQCLELFALPISISRNYYETIR